MREYNVVVFSVNDVRAIKFCRLFSPTVHGLFCHGGVMAELTAFNGGIHCFFCMAEINDGGNYRTTLYERPTP